MSGNAQHPTTWVLTDGKAGTENPCLALAEAMGVEPVVKRISIRRPWAWLPPQFWLAPFSAIEPVGGRPQLAPPWPDLLIANGRPSVAPALAIRRAAVGKTFAVQLQNPRVPPRRFDLVVAPRHDRLDGPNVLSTAGALHRVTPERLAQAAIAFEGMVKGLPRPLVAVMLGGPNRIYSFGLEEARRLAGQLAALARDRGVGLAITSSRRTPPEMVRAVRQALVGLPFVFWDASADTDKPNPYLGYLALADRILVTSDSVSMISEAAGTGKPVYVIGLAGGSKKFDRFHANMRETGAVRPFEGKLENWRYTPPDDTARAAARVAAEMQKANAKQAR
ncbi:MAG: mitochondrial fission ELM1 family protein [Alphaproteobacteria bacterium]|nr:mitochondrial fission ELM1 family protein [Alphaproteobacteria bacterium]